MAKKKAPTKSPSKNSVKGKFSFKTITSFLGKWILRIIIFFFVSTIATTLLYKYVPIPITPLMVIRVGEQLKKGKQIKLKKDWTSIDETGPMPLAVIAAEDSKFMDHIGFDFDAINKAVKYNKTHKKTKGASTISQQTAKNVFLWPGRTWIRKGLEVYFTLLIEIMWSKERILEVYLNVVEMGDGIYGAEAASQYYFKKPAQKLSRFEAAKIAAILPNPIQWSVKKPSAFVSKKQAWIRKNMDFVTEIDFE
ncbi:MAG: monofunctional biosynthetic peptidoglycan transglycosylase [Cytophagales bacterium]